MRIFFGILLGIAAGRFANSHGSEWEIGIGAALVAITILAWVIERKRKQA